MGHRGRAFARKAFVSLVIAVVLIYVPIPSWVPGLVLRVPGPLVILGVICYLGAALYDTLFYDHYR